MSESILASVAHRPGGSHQDHTANHRQKNVCASHRHILDFRLACKSAALAPAPESPSGIVLLAGADPGRCAPRSVSWWRRQRSVCTLQAGSAAATTTPRRRLPRPAQQAVVSRPQTKDFAMPTADQNVSARRVQFLAACKSPLEPQERRCSHVCAAAAAAAAAAATAAATAVAGSGAVRCHDPRTLITWT